MLKLLKILPQTLDQGADLSRASCLLQVDLAAIKALFLKAGARVFASMYIGQ